MNDLTITLFEEGLDTVEIALRYRVPEYVVANALAHQRERRQGREGVLNMWAEGKSQSEIAKAIKRDDTTGRSYIRTVVRTARLRGDPRAHVRQPWQVQERNSKGQYALPTRRQREHDLIEQARERDAGHRPIFGDPPPGRSALDHRRGVA